METLWMVVLPMALFLQSNAAGMKARDIEHLLHKYLFTGYNTEVRPVIDKSKPINVTFDLAYSQLVSLNAKMQILTSKVWVRQKWTNPLLTWDPKKFGNISTINVSPKYVWKPDIILYDSIQSGSSGEMYMFDTKVIVRYDGYTEWFAPTEIKSICKIDIKSFPFDEQFCDLVFGSWTYTGNNLDLICERSSADLTKYIPSGEWAMRSMTAKKNVVRYTCCPDPYVDITYTLHIQRRVLFYVNNLILPIFLLSTLAAFSFFAPPESGERISLVITIMLGMTVYMLIVTENIPPTSEVIPIVGMFCMIIISEIGLSLVMTCTLLRCFHKNAKHEMSGWFRYCIFNVLGPFLRFDPPKANHSISRTKFGRSRSMDTKTRKSYSTMVLSGSTDANYLPMKNCYPLNGSPNTSGSVSATADMLEEKIDRILLKMDQLIENIAEDQKVQGKRDEWKFAANVIDRLFFLLFTFTLLGSTTLMYFLIPEHLRPF